MDDEHCGLFAARSTEYYVRFFIVTPTRAIAVTRDGEILHKFSLDAALIMTSQRNNGYVKVEFP